MNRVSGSPAHSKSMHLVEHRRKFLLGSTTNVARGILSVATMLLLPPLLVHHLKPAEYSAWLLILQCSAYVNLLDLSLQTSIGKFVAQYDALNAPGECSRILSTSFALLCLSALLGMGCVGLAMWRLPELFHQVPPSVFGGLREGLCLVGLSTAITLPSSAFIAVFTGLQKYGTSATLWICSKTLSTVALMGVVLAGGGVIDLAWAMASFNLATAAARYFTWRARARDRVDFSFSSIASGWARRLISYSAVLSFSVIGVFFVSGLDLVIVGHYDYKQTGYYGVASEATSLMVLIVSSIFGPMLPAIAALQARRTPAQLGDATIRATRYCTLLICLVSLPLVLGAYPVLKLWVGHDYAVRSEVFLQILVLGNAIRLLGYPYSLVLVATEKLHLATLAVIAEAAVNFGLSIYLVRRIGAAGVAIGTLAGAFVSVGTHLLVSMRLTQSTAAISRRHWVLTAVLRPLSCVAPSLVLLSFWTRDSLLPLGLPWMAVWIASTFAMAWIFGLSAGERSSLLRSVAAAAQLQMRWS